MNLFVKLMLAMLVLAILLPFTILKNDQGKPLMSLKQISLPDMPSFKTSTSLSPGTVKSGGKDIFYKWYDAEGNVQFTTEPPADGIEYTVKGYDPNTNVIKAVEVPKEEVPEQNPVVITGGDTGGQQELNPYDPESIQKLMEETKAIEKLLNQRYEDQNSALNQ